ncbi:hypothetical protein V6N13_011706 [Hibiscus sabdariffa]
MITDSNSACLLLGVVTGIPALSFVTIDWLMKKNTFIYELRAFVFAVMGGHVTVARTRIIVIVGARRNTVASRTTCSTCPVAMVRPRR